VAFHTPPLTVPIPSGYFPEVGLNALAREAYEASGLTQAELGERLKVHRVTIVRALSEEPDRPYTALLVRIIEECSGERIEGPYYRKAGDET
jgi:DNA-binding XRE family transcriptional regulator